MNVTKLIAEYGQIPENICGGNLHIILDDENVDDTSVIFCYNECKKEKDYLGMLICSLLMGIDELDRINAINTTSIDYEEQIMMYYYF